MVYFIEKNGEVLHELPWFKDAAELFVKVLDTSKKGDYLKIYYIDKNKGEKIIRRIII